MFVYKNWKEVQRGGSVRFMCHGWFLFGAIPLIVWKIDVDLADANR